MRDDLIDLQRAHATQVKNEEGATAWRVEANITNRRLYSLSGKYRESEVFEILRFAREFEQKAFEAGISFQKELSKKMYQGTIDQLKEMNERAGRENERLAGALDDHTRKKEKN